MTESSTRPPAPHGAEAGERPTDYCEATARDLCDRIGAGEAMHSICEPPGMPILGTVQAWLTERPEFAVMLAAAREVLAQRLYDEIREIADAAKPATLQVDRTRIAVRQWQAARLASRMAAEAEDAPEGTGGFNVRIVRFAEDEEDDGAGDAPAL